jgi:hypothetical protein
MPPTRRNRAVDRQVDAVVVYPAWATKIVSQMKVAWRPQSCRVGTSSSSG